MRGRIRPAHSTVVAYLALFVALGGTAFAATGGNLILGKSNSATSTTGLSAGVNGGPAFKVTNTGAGTAATFTAPAGQPALKVSNAVKVPSLNADLLDGKDSTAFLGATAKATDSDKLDGKDSSAFLDGCPTPVTARFGRICAGSDGVQRLFKASLDQCAQFGLRLPTVSEANTLAVNYDVPGGDDDFWTDDWALDTDDPITIARVATAGENGWNGGAANANVTPKRTVCVTDPTNNN
jgi:hypothetical protein